MKKSMNKPAQAAPSAPKITARVHLTHMGHNQVVLDADFGDDHAAACAFAGKLKDLGVTIERETAETWD